MTSLMSVYRSFRRNARQVATSSSSLIIPTFGYDDMEVKTRPMNK